MPERNPAWYSKQLVGNMWCLSHGLNMLNSQRNWVSLMSVYTNIHEMDECSVLQPTRIFLLSCLSHITRNPFEYPFNVHGSFIAFDSTIVCNDNLPQPLLQSLKTIPGKKYPRLWIVISVRWYSRKTRGTINPSLRLKHYGPVERP